MEVFGADYDLVDHAEFIHIMDINLTGGTSVMQSLKLQEGEQTITHWRKLYFHYHIDCNSSNHGPRKNSYIFLQNDPTKNNSTSVPRIFMLSSADNKVTGSFDWHGYVEFGKGYMKSWMTELGNNNDIRGSSGGMMQTTHYDGGCTGLYITNPTTSGYNFKGTLEVYGVPV